MSENRVQIVIEGDARSAQVAITSTGKVLLDLSTQGEKASKSLKDADASTSKLGQSAQSTVPSIAGLSQAVQTLVAAVGLYKAAEFSKDSAMAAARYETLGVVMKVVGNNAGYTGQQMEALSRGVAEQGISLVESRDSVVRMAAAQLDLGKASELARVAQDAAVIANINSSDAFETLVQGIVSGRSEILHHMGIMVNFEEEYQKAARAVGKTSASLSEHEKLQIRMNSVLKFGENTQGAYIAAMDTAGKQVTSFQRYWQNLMKELGDSNLPAVTEMVRTMTERMKELTEYVKREDVQKALLGIGKAVGNAVEMAVWAAKQIGDLFRSALDGWNSLPEIIQKVGIVGAIFGGTTGRLLIAELALVAGYMERIAKVKQGMDLARSGQASYADIPLFDSDKYEEWLKQQNTMTGLEQRLASVRKELNSGSGVSFYADENQKRHNELLKTELGLMSQIDALRSKSAAGTPEDPAEAARIAAGIKRREEEERAAKQRIAEEQAKKIQETIGHKNAARDALAQVRADQGGDELLIEMTKLQTAYDKFRDNIAAKLKDKGLPGAAKAELEQAMSYENEKFRIQKEFIQKGVALNQDKLNAEREVQLASLEGVDTYYADLEAIQRKYAAARLKPDSPDAKWAGVMEAAERNKRTREQRQGNAERGLGLESDLNKGLSELYATQSSHSVGGALREQAQAVEIERQQRLLGLNEKLRQTEEAIYEVRRRTGDDLGPKDQEEMDARQKELALLNALLAVTDALSFAKQREIQSSHDWGSGARKGFQDYADAASNYASQAENAVKNAFGGMEDFLASFAVKGKASWSGLVDTILMDLVKIQIRSSMTGPLSNFLGGLNIFGSAQGNVLGGDGISALSNGIYSQPTFFGFDRHVTAFARGGVLGEAGPEAVMPLTRDSSGNLSVRAQGGGDTFIAHIHLTMPASSGNQAQDKSFADDVGDAMQSGLNTWWEDRYRQAHRPGAIANGGVKL